MTQDTKPLRLRVRKGDEPGVYVLTKKEAKRFVTTIGKKKFHGIANQLKHGNQVINSFAIFMDRNGKKEEGVYLLELLAEIDGASRIAVLVGAGEYLDKTRQMVLEYQLVIINPLVRLAFNVGQITGEHLNVV